MTPGKTPARKDLPQRVSIIMSISKNLSWYRFMWSSPTWSFIKDSKLTKTKPESCVRNAHLLEKKNNKNNRKEKTEKFVFQMKKGKKEVSPCKLFKIQGQFQHYSHWGGAAHLALRAKYCVRLTWQGARYAGLVSRLGSPQNQVWRRSIFRFCVYKFAEAVRYLKFKWEFVIIGRGCLVLLKVQVKFLLVDEAL